MGRKSLSIALSDTFGLRFGCAAVLWTRLGEGNPEGGGPWRWVTRGWLIFTLMYLRFSISVINYVVLIYCDLLWLFRILILGLIVVLIHYRPQGVDATCVGLESSDITLCNVKLPKVHQFRVVEYAEIQSDVWEVYTLIFKFRVQLHILATGGRGGHVQPSGGVMTEDEGQDIGN